MYEEVKMATVETYWQSSAGRLVKCKKGARGCPSDWAEEALRQCRQRNVMMTKSQIRPLTWPPCIRFLSSCSGSIMQHSPSRALQCLVLEALIGGTIALTDQF